jgi:hypothetical protein
MKVFISWSGTRSHKVAKLLSEWLNLVIQAAEPWVSSNDIERGTQWAAEINSELGVTNQGIFCLTAENKEAPWILFEAGSLAKGQTTSRVYTFLVDIKPSDVTGPLVLFNHTQPTEDDMLLLARSLNERLGDRKLPESKLKSSFDNAWPMFQARFKQILEEAQPESVPKDSRTEKEILAEVLDLVRNFDNRVRMLENKVFEAPIFGPGKRIVTREEYELRAQKNAGSVAMPPPRYFGGTRPDPVASEIWNSLKEGLDDDDIRGALMGPPHFLNAEQAAEQVAIVRKMLQGPK